MDLGGDSRVQGCSHSVLDFDQETNEYYCVMCGLVIDKADDEAEDWGLENEEADTY